MENERIELTSSHKDFKLVTKSSFCIQYHNITAPKPTRHYHYHDGCELYYLYSGERYYFIKDKSYHVKGGSIVLVNDYDVHATTNSAGHGYRRLLINFKREFLDGLLSALGNVDPFVCFEKDIHIITLEPAQRAFVESLLQTMMEQYRRPGQEESLFLKVSMLQLLLFINEQTTSQKEASDQYLDTAHKTIAQITGYINNNYQKDFSLDAISKQFYISPYYFSRTFKAVTGFTFTEYLNGVRVKEAQKLLCNSDMSIGAVAEAVGYKSSTHFGRLFKKANGMSPLCYRKYYRHRSER